MKSIARLITAWIFSGLVLAACGGGSTPPVPVVPPPPPSSNAALADLGLSTGSLDQVFQSDIKDYTGTTSFLGTTTILSATASDANASISINGADPVTGWASEGMVLAAGSNLVTITVMAEDG
ncbi:MAG: cadherin-like beta sandwich domain-containing protein, partial [Gammaproteobacteria bacterium]|nr:cadherin-like beta sandwich domain-containing protein [Gammaproteobacteria bacterium]